MTLARREFLQLMTGAAAAGSFPASALALD